MDINDLIEDLSQGVARSETVSAWCLATYGQAHQVYVNYDERDPPGEDACPWVALMPSDKTTGKAVERKQHVIEAVCCIHDETSQTYTDTNITEYKGVKRLETFRKYVEDAIDGVDIGNVLLDTVQIQYETIGSFPFMMAGMLINFGEPVVLGTDPLI